MSSSTLLDDGNLVHSTTQGNKTSYMWMSRFACIRVCSHMSEDPELPLGVHDTRNWMHCTRHPHWHSMGYNKALLYPMGMSIDGKRCMQLFAPTIQGKLSWIARQIALQCHLYKPLIHEMDNLTLVTQEILIRISLGRNAVYFQSL